MLRELSKLGIYVATIFFGLGFVPAYGKLACFPVSAFLLLASIALLGLHATASGITRCEEGSPVNGHLEVDREKSQGSP